VLYLIDVLANMGGAEKNLLDTVTSLNPLKYRPIVCCFKSGNISNIIKEKDIEVIDLNIKRIYDLNAIKQGLRLVNLIKKEKVKIVVTYFEGSDFWGGLIAKLSGVPLVISSRRDMGHSLKKRHVFAYKVFNSLFDRIITVSDRVRTMLIKKQGVPGNKVVTIYNGVETDKFNKSIDVNLIKKSLGISDKQIIVTIVARLDPIKGHKYFLEAASKLIKQNKNMHFLIVGADNNNGYLKDLKMLVDNMGINNDVTFTGGRSDIPEILAVSDILVLSSLSEGFSNTILEYMAAGKPVVATDVGGNREVILNGETGILVSPADSEGLVKAICELINDKQLSKMMGIKARKRIEDCFTTERMIKQIEELFETGLQLKTNKAVLEGSIQ